MTTSEGKVESVTKIVDPGVHYRWNLVVFGDGYTHDQLGQYHGDVQHFVQTFFATPPWDQLRPGINIWRVDVSSLDSGRTTPATARTPSLARTSRRRSARTAFHASWS
jgi:hypothetical protein